MKSKDQRVPILLTCGLIILDMNAGNGLAISLSVYLSLSKICLKKTKRNNTKQKAKRPRKKNLSSEGSRTSDLRRKRAT